MVDAAAWLCDAVIPEVPVRPWGLSLPHRERTLGAHDTEACAAGARSDGARGLGLPRADGEAFGVPRPRAGAVALQRFGGQRSTHTTSRRPYFVAFSSSLAFFRHSFACLSYPLSGSSVLRCL